jgi:hypothetical protein
MRRLELTERDVERVRTEPEDQTEDPEGRTRYVGVVRGRRVRVVVAVDNPDFVVTVHERKS